jgi:hypothetical protein
MKNTIVLAGACVIALGLTSCATILDGLHQDIGISSSPSGALCTGTRKGQVIFEVTTPQTVNVRKAKEDILLQCQLAGYKDASQYLHSGIETGTYGNIIAGGVVGWGIDSSTGADNKYPEAVTVQFTH